MLIVHNDLNNDYELSKQMVVVTSIASSSRRSIYQQSNKVKANLVIPQSSAPPVSQSRSPETTCLSHESLPFGCSWDPSKCRNFQTSKTQELFQILGSCGCSGTFGTKNSDSCCRFPYLFVNVVDCPKNQKVDIINSSQILSTCPAFFEQLSPWIFSLSSRKFDATFFKVSSWGVFGVIDYQRQTFYVNNTWIIMSGPIWSHTVDGRIPVPPVIY